MNLSSAEKKKRPIKVMQRQKVAEGFKEDHVG